MFKNIEIGKSKHLQAEIDHERISDIVFSPAFDRIMLAAIELNDEFRSRTVEIYDVVSNVSLPVEYETVELLSPQFGPKGVLGVCHVLAKRSGKGFEVSVKWERHY